MATLWGRFRTAPLWLKAIVLAVAYLAAAELGHLLSIQESFATFWPPSGLLLAVLLVSERRDWPLLLLGGFAGNVVSDALRGQTPALIAGFAAANLLESLVGATLLQRLIGRRPGLTTMWQAFVFTAVGAILAPVVGASVGTAAIVVASPTAVWWTTWSAWWIGDVLGIVVVGSVILTAVGKADEYTDGPGVTHTDVLTPLLRTMAVAVPFSVLAFYVFAPSGGATSWKFLTTPGIVGCALIGGPLGAAVGFAIIAMAGVGGMVFGSPVSAGVAPAALSTAVLQAQAFFAVGGVAALSLAGAIAESRASTEAAVNAAERFQLLFDTMREAVAYCRMIYDGHGVPVDWVYLQANEAYGELTGQRDVVGKHVWELFPGLLERSPEVLVAYAAAADHGVGSVIDSENRELGKVLRISVTSPARGYFLSVFEDVTERVAGERALSDSNRRLELMVQGVAEALGSVVEARDPYTQGHEVRVAELSRRIGAEMGLPEDELDGIAMAGLLHDIGKLRVPTEILTKPGVLSKAEFALIKEHPASGDEILAHIEFPWPVADIVRQHHERMDGSGYPQGLVGDEICLAARILAVADVVEAMASHRPYRPAVGLRQGVEEVAENLDRYDPAVVAACVALYERGETGFELS